MTDPDARLVEPAQEFPQINRHAVKFNLNDTVRVKLSARGRRHHFEEFKMRMRDYPPDIATYRPPIEDDDGWSEWQLHELMDWFGDYPAANFETMDIELVGDTWEQRFYQPMMSLAEMRDRNNARYGDGI